jgi:glucokinase
MEKKQDSLVLGIDLGGTKILSAVIDLDQKIRSRDHSVTPATQGQDAVMEAVVRSVRRCLEKGELDISRITAIGLGAPGPSNPDTGVLFTSPNLPGWENVPIRDVVYQEFGREVCLINDANAAALGEARFGAGRGARHFIYITVSTGIGGGVVIDGKVYTGSIGTAGELGHMTIDDEGPLCNCGNRGCWETLASGTALAREARRKVKEGFRTSILEHAGGDPEQITAQVVQTAAEQGDDVARELIARTGYYLGVGFANLINIFNPERIVIGGGLSNMGEMLFEPARKEARKRAYTVAYEAVRFVPASLGRNSGVLGAAAYAWDKARGLA